MENIPFTLRRSSTQSVGKPFRSKILTIEQLKQKGELTAAEDLRSEIDRFSKTASTELRHRFINNSRYLESAYLTLSEAAKNKEILSAGAEWLLDNFHLLDKEIREISRTFPKGYDKSLPKLLSGDLKNYPRIYHIAIEVISHSDAVVDTDFLSSYVNGYQVTDALTIGELWAIPIMLKFALIENLRRLITAIMAAREEKKEVSFLIDQIFENSPHSGTDLLIIFARQVENNPLLLKSKSIYLLRKLRDQGAKASLTLQWLEEKLRENHVEPDDLLRTDHQIQALDQISIGNTVTSLRTLGTIDWQKWFEETNSAHKILCEEPANVFVKCDFKTRDQYRHEIEKLAKKMRVSENIIARQLIDICSKVSLVQENTDVAHVGYYLIGDGKESFRQNIKLKKTSFSFIKKFARQKAFALYVISIFVLTTFLVAYLGKFISAYSTSQITLYILLLLSIIPCSDLAISIIQWVTGHIVEPKLLPKLDLTSGISPDHRTLVAIQAIFEDKDAIQKTVEGLEVKYLANEDENLYFAIIADLPDRKSLNSPDDHELLDYGKNLIQQLNIQHPSEPARFHILFRERKWNEKEQKFMGWERKRGKVCELNQLILNKGKTTFLNAEVIQPLLNTIKYVLTLDTDTQLPFGSAQQLIGAIAHPLNKAVIDEKRNVVKSGYGIIQARVGMDLTSANATLFSQIFAGHAGLDPYTNAISDFYYDIFGQGSFYGKGIYNVEVFEKVINNRVPENSVLSHDLFEGLFARVGLCSDVELIDEFPAKYNSYVKRQHRWVRGDWQLLPWLSSQIPDSKNNLYTSPLKNIDRWKLFDNLRRSLIAPTLLLYLLAGWFLLPQIALSFTLVGLLFVAFPIYTNVAQIFIMPPVGLSLSIFARGFGSDLLRLSYQSLLAFIFLPHQAFTMLHAICTTIYRVYFSRKNLLEWQTAYYSENRLSSNLRSFFRLMIAAPIVGFLALFYLLLTAPTVPLLAVLFIISWIIAPWIANQLGIPRINHTLSLKEADKLYLNKIAFDTWKYYRENNSQYNNLVPDNIQVKPTQAVADRTSPTNIALYLSSCLAAYELGYESSLSVINKISATFETILKLEKHRGHLLNWYKTVDLAALHPRYVSFVDSGNFAAVLIVLREGLQQILNKPIIGQNFIDHIRDLATKKQPVSPKICLDTFSKLVDELNTYTKLHLSIEDLNQCQDSYKILKEFTGNNELSKITTFPSINELVNLYEKTTKDNSTAVQTSYSTLLDYVSTARNIIANCNTLLKEMDFSFLYDHKKNIFFIGYNIDDARLDGGHYDLLASEARLGSLVCIAKGDVSVKHWFRLGRPLANTLGGKSLLSWSGTMFEFLMPVLFTKNYPNTLLSRTYDVVINAQRVYGVRNKVPWGISESAYSRVDLQSTYQYRAFGVPGLGLKRGLENDLVISPYSTMLSLPILPELALKNLRALEKAGLRGEYGFYESADYTKDRLAQGEEKHIIHSFFAHHQGMGLIAITNLLKNNILQEIFHSDPSIKAIELLLQERFPQRVTLAIPQIQDGSLADRRSEQLHTVPPRIFHTAQTTFPKTHVLSNGRITTMIDNAGSGFTTYDRDISLTRWKEDLVSNKKGTYIFLKDTDENVLWSNTFQPLCDKPDYYEVIYNIDKAEIKRRDNQISLLTEVTVSPDDNVEIRRVTITNFSSKKKSIQLTSYSEVALANTKADAAHPAFSKMFIESEFLNDYDTLLFSRRPRSQKEDNLFLFHSISMKTVWEPLQYETSRMNFLGRGNDISSAQALQNSKLSCETGFILDPIFSLRTRIEIEPNSSETVSFITGASNNRSEIVRLAKRYIDNHHVARAFEMAWSQSSVELRNEQYSLLQTQTFQSLANALFFSIKELRGDSKSIIGNKLKQPDLWRSGISGDLPIVLVKLYNSDHIKLAQELITAHYYLRNRGVAFDLVILNEFTEGYFQHFQDELSGLMRSGLAATWVDKKGGIFLRNQQQLNKQEVTLLESIARVVLDSNRGSLAQQLNIKDQTRDIFIEKQLKKKLKFTSEKLVESEGRIFDNTFGYFSEKSKEYSININSNKFTPLPWSNVIANKTFGTITTELGGGYTWSENSRENRLSSWSNDPVTDPLSEIIYIRDTDTNKYWCPTPRPVINNINYSVTHGFGYTIYKSNLEKLRTELKISVSNKEKLKWYNLKIVNSSATVRSLEVFLFVDWVLGVNKEDSQRYIVSDYDQSSQYLYAVNNYNNEFAQRCVYIGSNLNISTYTTDRAEFIGRNSTLATPRVLEMVDTQKLISFKKNFIKLSERSGAGYDNCGVIKVIVEIPANEEKEMLFFIGETDSLLTLKNNQIKFKTPSVYAADSAETRDFWGNLTNKIQITSPSKSFNLLMNGWLLYQTVSCRLFARSGFYQSGGAIGFRDQLQDVLALLPINPIYTKEQILIHAKRQFIEGDVQHWWHPPTGRGVRTKISDDLLWLPYVTAEYIKTTGDSSILDEHIGYIEGQDLGEQHEAYIVPQLSTQSGSLYDHCVRAIERSLTVGKNGLPLIGTGDWNDGMNEVGKDGKGESVWLGWFLSHVLMKFTKFTDQREPERTLKYQTHAASLIESIEKNCWDGSWYLRAFFDDGTKLGSSSLDECKIDSLSQSWATICGGGENQRAITSLDNVLEQLVDKNNKIIKLLYPPFNKSSLEPGYIKGYLPGVRENGGQYTHAGAWVIIAAALQNRTEEALSLFELMNPINHAFDQDSANKYKGEPYVMCGDVYSVEPHNGRAGWSWYTGSAGWMYQAGLHYILGFQLFPDHIIVNPCIPKNWDTVDITYTGTNHVFNIHLKNVGKSDSRVKLIKVNGKEVTDNRIPLYNHDSNVVEVEVIL